jgi:hypothetical protein
MVNREMYQWIRELSNDSNFSECIAISDRAAEEQYDMELALRFLVFRSLKEEHLRNLGELGEFLTQRMVEISERKDFDYPQEERAFRGTFEILKEQLGGDSFRRYDGKGRRFLGGFSVSAFEAVALGIGYNFKKVRKCPSTVPEKVRRIWSDDTFTKSSGSGIRASSRVPKTIPYGRKLFAE